MRGARSARRRASDERRIIPAYAGSTLSGRRGAKGRRDHPRVCGEHAPGSITHRVPPGSSRRMRGAQLPAVHGDLQARIIPAYAGSTESARTESTSIKDHPRVCGEHEKDAFNNVDIPGSSPRMRGAPNDACSRASRLGIIPAYAGSTLTFIIKTQTIKDHPRVCGEHSDMERLVSTETGSSPRMRGARARHGRYLLVRGIIPAYAGSTGARRGGFSHHGDHPRVCGEHEHATGVISWFEGSSPRMRGAPYASLYCVTNIGIIPAYAGSTLRIAILCHQYRDHPRVCGEHVTRSMSALSV